jgi:hypothetical protein
VCTLWQLTIYSTLRNQLTSPLLRLPAELRNRIYAYALAIELPIDIVADGLFGKIPRPQVTIDNTHPDEYLKPFGDRSQCWQVKLLSEIQSITSVCHQTRAETALLKYTINDFAIDMKYLQNIELLPEDVCKGVCVLRLEMDEDEWPPDLMLGLRRLPVLERVVLEPARELEYRLGCEEGDLVRAAIRKYVGREIKVVDF